MSTNDDMDSPSRDAAALDGADRPREGAPRPTPANGPVLRASVLGGGLAFVYGLCARFLADGSGLAVMSIAFCFVVPLVLGALTVWWHPAPSRRFRVFAPWVPTAAAIGTLGLMGFEGVICIVIGSPFLFLFASIGGAMGSAFPRRGREASLPALMLLPYLAWPFEQRIPEPERVVETVTAVDIDAPPATVWPLVASVDSIRPDERRPALFLAMGFPQPIAATLSHPGIGGVRVATFDGGLRFTETVTVWEPGRRLRFSIRANGESVPPETLDQHVRLGGRYFDVLVGEYELVPLDGGRRTHLVLRSEHRLNTHFNPYAAWWTDRVMRSIQLNIQDVHRRRAERRRGART